ncbi:MAG: DnaJ domain-containing protein [Acidimicrobiia bacterium]
MTTRSLDHYEVLGVAPEATQDEIAARFRALARSLHPDARPVDPDAADDFKRITTAYRVLGDPARRSMYDRRRTAPITVAPVPTMGRARPPRLTRRGARWAVLGGIAAVVFGVVASVLVIALQRHDAALRRDGVGATATVVEIGGDRRLEFVGPDGELVRAPEPLKSGTGRPPLGSQVEIRYDPDDPTTVIRTESQLARDITLWIVAVKLIVGGLVFVVVGAHRLRRPAP